MKAQQVQSTDNQIQDDRITVTVQEACRLLGVSRSFIYREFDAKRLARLKSGKKALVAVAALKDWASRLQTA